MQCERVESLFSRCEPTWSQGDRVRVRVRVRDGLRIQVSARVRMRVG